MNSFSEFMRILKEMIPLLQQTWPGLVAFILTIILEVKFHKILNKGTIADKIEKAKELGQVVKGTICSKDRKRTNDRKYVHAKYRYVIDGKEGEIWRKFSATGTFYTFPDTINVYYLNGKVFTDSTRGTDTIRNIIIGFLPFIVGALVLYFTN